MKKMFIKNFYYKGYNNPVNFLILKILIQTIDDNNFINGRRLGNWWLVYEV
jgi:hypothetical protein